MLNDFSGPTRLVVGGLTLPLGLLLGAFVFFDSASSGGVLTVFLLVSILYLTALVGFQVWLRRADKRFRHEVYQGACEIADGVVAPAPAIGRVVRRRIARDIGWWLPRGGRGDSGAVIAVVTAVGDGPARRVAVAVPASLGLHLRHEPVALLTHPDRREVAVLDDRVDQSALERIGSDPRWHSEKLPTDATVRGSSQALFAAAAVAFILGLGLAFLILGLGL